MLDLVIMTGSFALVIWLKAFFGRTDVEFSDLLSIRLKVVNFLLFLCFLLLWHFIFTWAGLYRSRRLSSPIRESWDVLKATSLGSIAVLTVGFLLRIELITPRFMITFWVICTLLTVVSRLVIRAFQARARLQGRNLRRILIVGTNPRALRFAREIRDSPELGYSLVGFVDEEWLGTRRFLESGEIIVCDFAELPGYLRKEVVDELVVALPASSGYARSAEVIGLCEQQGIIVRLLTDLFDLRLARARVEEFHHQPVITLYTGSMNGGSMLAKRALDFSVSLILLTVQVPVFVMIGLAIKLSSPGPVFFLQERIGLNKRRFKMLKFRTMVADAEKLHEQVDHLNEASGPVFKIKDDPRITSVGRFLRRTSLDEMPQLINVLRGDMSLVGPRPLPVRDYAGFDEDWHRRRFSVRPGITCLWQVDGRSSIPFERWMELDMQYIDEWSLWLDMRILAKTIPAVVRGTGAS